MEIEFKENSIHMDKELNELDNFVLKFCQKLDKTRIKYCIVSGYVAIVFGRSRATEDVDIITEKISREKFFKLWQEVLKDFQCINAFSVEEAYAAFLTKGYAIRFSKPNKPLPNIEFKFFKTKIDQYTLEKSLTLYLNKYKLSISPIELQIAFKLYLGSEKDIEDARHLYKVFIDKLNKDKLSNSINLLKIDKKTVNLLGRAK